MDHNDRLSAVRGFLLDMDGTFYLSDRLLDGALRFIDVLRRQDKQFLFLTNNSSKQGRQYAEKISRLGLPLTEESVLTSGEATALHLKAQLPGGDLYVVGTPSLEEEFRNHGFRLVEEDPQFLEVRDADAPGPLVENDDTTDEERDAEDQQQAWL